MTTFPTYSSWVFDCDGVLLDSNEIKTRAFAEVARPYGQEAAESLVAHHILHGGVSRFEKFRHFWTQILKRDENENAVAELCGRFGDITSRELLACDETPGLHEALAAIPSGTRKIVVSGSPQEELRTIFGRRGLTRHFDGVYGSPDTKIEILNRESANGALSLPGVYVGDARLDYEAARAVGLDFVFMVRYSEWDDAQASLQGTDTVFIHDLRDLVTTLRNKAGAYG